MCASFPEGERIFCLCWDVFVRVMHVVCWTSTRAKQCASESNATCESDIQLHGEEDAHSLRLSLLRVEVQFRQSVALFFSHSRQLQARD